MIAIQVKDLFHEVGIEDVRPTEGALNSMGMSRRRFTQLIENVNKTPITVEELESIKNWISHVKEIEPDEILGQSGTSWQLKEKLGLVK